MKTHTTITFVILIPIFLVVSLVSSKLYDARKFDFAEYWLAGHMILSGENVYDSREWVYERALQNSAYHSEPTFQYPLPFAILFAPLSLLPIESAYTLWIFFSQIAILISIVILLDSFPEKSPYLGLLTVAGIFLFRPMFTVILSGQILSVLLLSISFSILLLRKERWFFSGFVLSLLSLKPSIGFPLLALISVWFVSRKKWRGMLGLALGGVTLLLMGFIVNPKWVVDYLEIGGNNFTKYYGVQPTLWGVADQILKANNLSVAAGATGVAAILAVEARLFLARKFDDRPIEAFASILPAGLLIAPYSWAYDQILLAAPIVYLVTRISLAWGNKFVPLFLFGVVGCAVALVFIAYQVGHDVWSSLNSFLIWIFVLYFLTGKSQNPGMTQVSPVVLDP